METLKYVLNDTVYVRVTSGDKDLFIKENLSETETNSEHDCSEHPISTHRSLFEYIGSG